MFFSVIATVEARPGLARTIFLMSSAMALIATPIIFFLIKKLSYASATYRVFGDRIEFEQQFPLIRRTTIFFKDVSKLILQENILQRRASLGSVQIVAKGDQPSIAGLNSLFDLPSLLSGNNVMRDIRDARSVYEEIGTAVRRLTST